MNEWQIDRIRRILHRADIAAWADRPPPAALVGCQGKPQVVDTTRRIARVDRRTTGQQSAGWRIESAKIIASLARIVRDVGLAEDLAQDALVIALEWWPETGIPNNPGAWLTATAKHRAIDRLRRNIVLEHKHEELGLSTRRGQKFERAALTHNTRERELLIERAVCLFSKPSARARRPRGRGRRAKPKEP